MLSRDYAFELDLVPAPCSSEQSFAMAECARRQHCPMACRRVHPVARETIELRGRLVEHPAQPGIDLAFADPKRRWRAGDLTVTPTKTTVDPSVDSWLLPCWLSPALPRDGDPSRDLALNVRRTADTEQRNSVTRTDQADAATNSYRGFESLSLRQRAR